MFVWQTKCKKIPEAGVFLVIFQHSLTALRSVIHKQPSIYVFIISWFFWNFREKI